MKKKMLLIIPLCMLLVGCSKSAADIENMYNEVINGNQTFSTEDTKGIFIDNYEKDYYVYEYGIMNINNDEVPEMIIRFQQNKYDYFYLVLTYYKNKVYGIKIDDETFVGFTYEGYSSFIDSDNNTSGWRTYKLSDGKLSYDVKSSTDYNSDGSCEFDGKTIDCNEISDKVNEWLETSENIKWVTYEKKNS